MPKIPGTRVDDNALHRASLWLQTFQGTEEGAEIQLQDDEAQTAELARFIAECGIKGVTAREIADGVRFYGTNFAVELFGNMRIQVASPYGVLGLDGILRSVWLDGLKHGVALHDGKRGLSNLERRPS